MRGGGHGRRDCPLREHNIFTTFARHESLLRRWLPFGAYLLAGGHLPARLCELLILRTGYNCGSSYEWGQHVRIGLGGGLTRADIDRIASGPDADGWSEQERVALRVADELHRDAKISDETWAALSTHFDEKGLIEIPILVGHYPSSPSP